MNQLSEHFHEIYRHTRSIYGDDEWYIVPVPMHWSRYSMRGFDHMQLIASSLSKLTEYPTLQLLTTAYRPRQTRLTREVRLANKKNAFKIRSGFKKIPENVILIDDVISSGSTANSCAQILKESGVKKVIGWFLASNN
jgi:ComF family protein